MLEAVHCRWSTAFFAVRSRHAWRTVGRASSVTTARSTAGWAPCSAVTTASPRVYCFLPRAQSDGSSRRSQAAHRAGVIPRGGISSIRTARLMPCRPHSSSAQLRADHRAVGGYSQRLLEVAEKYNLPPQRTHAVFMSGWERAFTTDLDAGVSVMEAEFPRASAIGLFFRYYAALLAEGRERAGRFADALTVLRPALGEHHRAGSRILRSRVVPVAGHLPAAARRRIA